MLEFKTSTKKTLKKDADDKVPFKIDGEEFIAKPAAGGALTLLIASGASDNPSEQVWEIMQFFKSILSTADMTRITNKLRDTDDPFELTDLINVMQGLVAEFAGRPTE